MAEDLHDGILQVLTASALELETITRMLDYDAEGAKERLLRVSRQISGEQRELRFLVDELRAQGSWGSDVPFLVRLEETVERLRTVWNLDVAVDADGACDPTCHRTVLRLVQEAVTNAVRHGEAAAVQVEISDHPSELRIRVRDDGSGFPFTGHFTHEALVEQRRGPLSLRRRVESVGGTLEIKSEPFDTVLSIRIPQESSH